MKVLYLRILVLFVLYPLHSIPGRVQGLIEVVVVLIREAKRHHLRSDWEGLRQTNKGDVRAPGHVGLENILKCLNYFVIYTLRKTNKTIMHFGIGRKKEKHTSFNTNTIVPKLYAINLRLFLSPW